MQKWRWRLEEWWWRQRFTVRSILFPLICIQFVRTLFFPNPIDVLVLFLLFLFYLGFLFRMY